MKGGASLLGTPGGMLGVLTSHVEGGPSCRQTTTVGRLWVSICSAGNHGRPEHEALGSTERRPHNGLGAPLVAPPSRSLVVLRGSFVADVDRKVALRR